MLLTEALVREDDRVAVVSPDGSYRYSDLARASNVVASALSPDGSDLAGARVAIFLPPGFEFVAVLFGIWRAGGVAVPLPLTDPPAALERLVLDADISVLVSTAAFAHTGAPIAVTAGARLVTAASLLSQATGTRAQLALGRERPALLLYTSGTTGRPKGVVHTHGTLSAQVESLLSAWEWSPADRALLTLPLHHVHGLVNVVSSALAAGACCEMQTRFDAALVWSRLASGDVTVFTAVPTVYHRLIAAWNTAPADTQRAWSDGARQMRLMMSGSAALPAPTLERWRAITGHTLLERYGMTEFGMALSNPLHGERRAGWVGTPLPGLDVRLVDEHGAVVPDGMPGEIEVRGATVFSEYWRQPSATRDAFRDGWFRTGDVAVHQDAAFRILGRMSQDIIKTGGEKISALEVEDALRAHPGVADCAAVGVADPEWGERLCVAVELCDDAGVSPAELQSYLAARLAPAKVPKAILPVPALPRNAMGKVVKPDVASWFARR